MAHFLYTPFNCNTAPDGAWVLLDIPDNHGQPIAQVREFKIDQLYLHELSENLELTPDKKKYLVEYVLMLREGQSPPLIDVIQTEDGRDKVVDGHRRTLAAAAIGLRTIKGLFSPLVNDPDVGLRGLTLDLLQSGFYKDDYAEGKRYFEGFQLQVLQSAAGFYVGTLSEDGYPHSRISVEYWQTLQEAQQAFTTHNYTTRHSSDHKPLEYFTKISGLDEIKEPPLESETDWLIDLIGTKEQNEIENEQREKLDKWVRTVVAEEIVRIEMSIQDWAGRVYKENRTKIDLFGDGPAKREQMSVGAINESRRNRAIAGLTEELSYLKELETLVSKKFPLETLKSKFGAMKEDADKTFSQAKALGRAKTQQEWFEQVLLSTLDIRGSGYRGSVASNSYSRMLATLLYREEDSIANSPEISTSVPSLNCGI